MDTNPDFTPVPLKARHDGWTPARQHEFIMRLADSGSVAAAARHVGMSLQSAYRLGRHPDAGDFRLAWDAALDQAAMQFEQIAVERVIHGDVETVEKAGAVVRSIRKPCSDRLLIYMMERTRRRRTNAVPAYGDPQAHEAGKLADFARVARNFPDRPGLEGPELDIWDLRNTQETPKITSAAD